MILAVKDKIACYYNNKVEKYELLEMFPNLEHKVFVDSNKEDALLYANTSKITGFSTDEMNSFDIFSDLKEEGIQVVSFYVKNNTTNQYDKKVVVLNPVYYIISDKRLTYSSRLRRLTNMTFSGNSHDSVNNFCAQIYELAKETGLSIEKAAYTYFEAYKKEFGKYPWKELKASDISIWNYENGYIKLEAFGSRVREMFNYEEEYSCDLKDERNWNTIALDNIKDIQEYDVSIAIKDKNIISVIDEY